MVEKKVVSMNETGLMGRPAANFVQASNNFVSDVYLEKDHKVFNGKSIMSVLSMGAGKGASFILRTDGADEEEALTTLLHFLENEMDQY